MLAVMRFWGKVAQHVPSQPRDPLHFSNRMNRSAQARHRRGDLGFNVACHDENLDCIDVITALHDNGQLLIRKGPKD